MTERDDSALALASGCDDVTGEQRLRERDRSHAFGRVQHLEPAGVGRAREGAGVTATRRSSLMSG